MAIIMKVKCPNGHEIEYGRMYIDMTTGKVIYACMHCKANYEGYLLLPQDMEAAKSVQAEAQARMQAKQEQKHKPKEVEVKKEKEKKEEDKK